MGSDAAGRFGRNLEQQMGMFLNTISIRAKVRKTLSFKQFISYIQNTLNEVLANQDFPFNQLVEELGASTLFNVFVLSQRIDSFNDIQMIPEVDIEPVSLDSGYSKFDLSFIFGSTKEGNLLLSLEYNSAFISVENVHTFATQFMNTLQCFTSYPEALLRQSPEVNREEQDKLNQMMKSTLI